MNRNLLSIATIVVLQSAALPALAGEWNDFLLDLYNEPASAEQTKLAMGFDWLHRSATDTRILSSMKTQLVADSVMTNSKIDVDVKGGQVILKGVVLTQEQQERAIELAKGIKGVSSVQSQLVVTNPKPTALTKKENILEKTADQAGTTILATKVRANLLKNGLYDGNDIDVTAMEDKTVVLKGRVKSASQKVRVEQLVQATEGVGKVMNQLIVKKR